jgi:dihydrofolate reductase
MTTVSIIVAVAENGVIGKGNTLPWHLPEDLRHFKQVTMGKPIIMGRRTFESIGKPLPGRTNIVITRDPTFHAAGTAVVFSLEEALALARNTALRGGVDEVVVIGGAEIYATALPRADRLYLTEVHAAVEGDALLPPIDWTQWREVSRERHDAQSPRHHAFSIVCYERAVA